MDIKTELVFQLPNSSIHLNMEEARALWEELTELFCPIKGQSVGSIAKSEMPPLTITNTPPATSYTVSWKPGEYGWSYTEV